MQPIYTSLKVNNEIELCEIFDLDCKQQIERELLQQRISFYIRWPKSTLFRKYRNTCIICVNENFQDEAETLVRGICDEMGYSVRFLLRKSQNDFL